MYPRPDSSAAMGIDLRSDDGIDGRSRRRLRRLLLRLEQSRRGFHVASSVAADPATRDFLASLSTRRSEMRRSLQARTPTAGRSIDIAGVIHRPFIRFLAGSGDAAILDECDRGESSLLRALRRLPESIARPGSEATLAAWEQEIIMDVERIRRRRRERDRSAPQAKAPVESPTPGARAPAFSAPASTGQTIELRSYAGKVPIVVFFTSSRLRRAEIRELVEFQSRLGRFADARVQVMAVAPRTARRTRELSETHQIAFPIVADPDNAIRSRYGIDRRTAPAAVLIDDRGVIVRSYRNLHLPGFAGRALETVTELREAGIDGFVR